MALWKAVADRYQLLSATFDGGRVGPTERERLSTLIWGRLDAARLDTLAAAPAPAALAVSLPEACRLSDALAAQLRTRAVAGARRRRQRRPDQGPARPAGAPARPGRPRAGEHPRRRHRRVARPARHRAADVTARAQRGADVGGLLGPLEQDAARLERDLIVGASPGAATPATQAIAARGAAGRPRGPGGGAARPGGHAACAPSTRRRASPCPTCRRSGPVPGHRGGDRAPTWCGSTGSPARSRSRRTVRGGARRARPSWWTCSTGTSRRPRALGVAGNADLVTSERQARDVLDREPAPLARGRASWSRRTRPGWDSSSPTTRPGTRRSPHEHQPAPSPAAPAPSSTATATCAGSPGPPARTASAAPWSRAASSRHPLDRRRPSPTAPPCTQPGCTGHDPRRLLRRLRLARRRRPAAGQAAPASPTAVSVAHSASERPVGRDRLGRAGRRGTHGHPPGPHRARPAAARRPARRRA